MARTKGARKTEHGLWKWLCWQCGRGFGMIKVEMEVNKKVGAGAQKSGAVGAGFGPNKRAAGVRAGSAARGSKAGAADLAGLEQLDDTARELVEKLAADYPELRFRVGKKFMFRSPRTVVTEAGEAENGASTWALQLLHEVGHAVSGHRDFRTDPERLKMEREAWERARELATAYNIWYDEKFVEGALDTYRDWLHQRSACPECGLTRYQTQDGQWHCPGCEI